MLRYFLTLTVLVVGSLSHAQEKDSRLGKPKDFNGYFPWTPPASKESWDRRKQVVKEQVLVANGLWPMPERAPIKATIHGKIDRDEYTIEKVFFASYPGHYVTGNLYRPKNAKGQLPGVLCPHGHWANGRFYEANEKAAAEQMKQQAEATKESAQYPLQARCAMLARLGCVVFHYDMVGYADSQQIKHREGFTDAESELRLQSFMGLQTFNSIRALDFLLGLPDVDAKRIGVTGASGGGTQTFLLCGIDDRVTTAVPAVMVSTAMQGGCACENCTYLRIGTGNIELAGLFAPKPMFMIGADDWTREIETKGYPELKTLYKLTGAPANVGAKALTQFKHNYNQPSRELMYNWFNEHLKLGVKGPITEKPFTPVPPKELSVFDDKHTLPKDAVDAKGLRAQMTRESNRQIQAVYPKDAAAAKEYRKLIGTALRAMITDELPASNQVEESKAKSEMRGDLKVIRKTLSRKGTGEVVPIEAIAKGEFAGGPMVLWVHPQGLASLWKDGKLVAEAQKIVDSGAALVGVEVLRTGASASSPAPIKGYAGFVFGYNRPLIADRVHDILTAIAWAKDLPRTKEVRLVGFEGAGPWVALASALAGNAVSRTAVDWNQFRFEEIASVNDENLLPGALKYGGLEALAGLAAPQPLLVHNTSRLGEGNWLAASYAASGAASALRHSAAKQSGGDVVEWLLAK